MPPLLLFVLLARTNVHFKTNFCFSSGSNCVQFLINFLHLFVFMMQLENAIRRCNRENVLTVFTVSAVIIVDLKKSITITKNRVFWHFPPEIYPKNTRGKLLGFFGKSSGIFSRNFCATQEIPEKWVRKWPHPQPSLEKLKIHLISAFDFPES